MSKSQAITGKLIIGTFVVLSLITVPSSRASFLGQTLDYEYLYPDSSSVYYHPAPFVVGGGVELPALFSSFPDDATVDISSANILVDYYSQTFWSSGLFNGFRLFDVNGTIPAITSVTVNGATSMVGFSSANVSFDADHIFVNWQGLAADPGTIVSLDVGFAPVPEPTTMIAGALLLLPFGASAVRLMRKKSAA